MPAKPEETMTAQTRVFSPFRSLVQFFELMLRRPPRTQLAALCYRASESGPEVLLITSRNTKRLIIPKGWPMAKRTARKTAEREAYEEAGIIGKTSKEPIGEFSSFKGLGNGFKVRTNVVVYPLAVVDQVSDFPETGQRELIWMPLNDAIERCQDDGLRLFLKSKPVHSLLMDDK
jgi:8-oxo-dGTP pyrophosphatase MutT (NUDIX family)